MTLYEDMAGQFALDPSARKYLVDHEAVWDDMLDKYSVEDRDMIKMKIYTDSPRLGMRALIDYERSEEEKIKMVREGLKVPGLLWVLFGGKGCGKTFAAWWLLEQAHEMGREIYYSGIPLEAAPEWANFIPNPFQAPMGSALYIPETAITFPARRSMGVYQRDALAALFSLRHGGRILIAETQAARALDIQFLRTMDVAVLKPAPMLALDERDPAMKVIEYLRPSTKHQTLIYGKGWFTMLKQPKAECWCEELSNPVRPITDPEQAIKTARFFHEFHGFPLAYVQRLLSAMGHVKSTEEWAEIMAEHEFEGPPVLPKITASASARKRLGEGGEEVVSIEEFD